MTLCDAGPLVALIDEDDEGHASCLSALPFVSLPLVTTWSCFTEAMYLLGRHGGWPAQAKLWMYLERGVLRFHIASNDEAPRMRVLMEQYRDTPMDLADASLVAAAEALGERWGSAESSRWTAISEPTVSVGEKLSRSFRNSTTERPMMTIDTDREWLRRMA